MNAVILHELASLASKRLAGLVPDAAISSQSPGQCLAATPDERYRLEPLAISSAGYFPYYWLDPASQLFNFRTYNWLATCLRAAAVPAELDDACFSNLFLQALSAIEYSLSSKDVARLEHAAAATLATQKRLLDCWQQAFGPIPLAAGALLPIDIIMGTITTSWASPPTTMLQMQQAPELQTVLNTMPAQGNAVLPVLQLYLRSLGTTIPLQDAGSKYRGYLAEVIQAIQFPMPNNGGLKLNDQSVNPAFAVRQSVAQILARLNSPHTGFKMTLVVNQRADSLYEVALNGNTYLVPSLQFLNIRALDTALDLEHQVSASTACVTIELAFEGFTTVDFGPVSFNPATGENWFWMAPVREAIKNGGSDVTGFKFSPQPQIDFGLSGPFGFLTRVGITRHPSIIISSVRSDYAAFQQTVAMAGAAGITLAGNPTAQNQPASTHVLSSAIDIDRQSISVTFSPVPDAGGVASTAFVVGVKTHYPASA